MLRWPPESMQSQGKIVLHQPPARDLESRRCLGFVPQRIRSLGARTLLLVAVTSALACSYPRQRPNPPPNVLFVLIEDQGAHAGFLGTPGLETPNLDRIARAGVYFTRAYVNYPLCSASKAALYTGLYGHTNGVYGNTPEPFGSRTADSDKPSAGRLRLDDRYPTLIEVLRDAGFFTGVVDKLHVQPRSRFPFDEWIRVRHHVSRNPRERRSSQQELLLTAARRSTAAFIRRAQEQGRPFFLMAGVTAPHRPWRDSEKAEIGVDPAAVKLPAFIPDTRATRKDWAEYLDACQRADGYVGQMLRALADTGVEDRTLVILTADHGPAFHRGKMSLYELGLQVPLAIKGPGIARGVTRDELVAEIDLMPTILDLLGLPRPGVAHGISFRSVLSGQPSVGDRRYIFAEIVHHGRHTDGGMQERSVFDGRWKLIHRQNRGEPRQVNPDLKYWLYEPGRGRGIHYRNRTYPEIVRRKHDFPREFDLLTRIDPQEYGVELPAFELYDVASDPYEMTDLAAVPRYREHLLRLKAELRDWAVRTGDRFIDPAQVL